MRKKIYIILTLIVVLLTSCTHDSEVNEVDRVIDDEEMINETLDSSSTENSSEIDISESSDDIELGYTVESNRYSYKNINVIYPSVEGMETFDTQKVINKLLKEEALSFVTIMEESKDALNYELEYNVVFQDNDFMSIVFKGYRYMDGAPYPVDVFYSTNVDLRNAKKLVLRDMVLIDENFVSLYVQYLSVDRNEELKNFACEYLINSLNPDNLIEGFSKADMLYGSSVYVYSYFTGTSVGLSWEVPHSVGDHIEVEIPIEVLFDNIKAGVLDNY